MNVLQTTTKTLGQSFSFLHIADVALSDVRITIYNASNGVVLANQVMGEIASSGVYKFVYTAPAVGVFTGVMSSASAMSKSVTELTVIAIPASSSGSVVISNNVGTGVKGEC